ncbi:MAG: LptA/OstA family protein [Verrucomicrobiaceae bacterium]
MRPLNLTHVPFACLVLLLTPTLSHAQSGKNFPIPARADAAKGLTEASEILNRAKASSTDELARRALEEAKTLRAREIAAQASPQAAKPSFAEQQRQVESATRLNAAMAQVSPRGQALLAQEASAPAMRAPAEPLVDVSLPASTPVTPVASATRPAEAASKKDNPQHTTIDCQGAAFFDSKQGLGVFTEDVVVHHPQFHLTGDVLEVYMKKDKKDGKTSSAPGPPPPGSRSASDLLAEDALNKPSTAPDATPAEDTGIETAIAKGRRVVIQKASETGELQVGICRHATYIGATGDIVMRDYPQVQRGKETVRGTSPATVLTLKQNGQLLTDGPTTVDIIQQEPKKSAGTPPSAPAPILKTTSPGGPQ